MKISEEAVGRLACVDADDLLVACASIAQRLRRVCTGPVTDRAAADRTRQSCCVALMQLLSVLDANGTNTDEIGKLRVALDTALKVELT
jgi:hypothetical protein